VDITRTVGIRGDEDERRILPEMENGDKDREYFKWWGRGGKI
jgi:hypothetical protein